MRRIHADLLLLLAAAIWGTAFYFQKTAMDHIGPLLFVTCRSAVAALSLLSLAILEAHRAAWHWPPRLTSIAAAAGCTFFIAAGLQQLGIITATVTNAGLLTSLYVVATPIIGWAFLHQKPNLYVWPAVILAIGGTWMLSGGTVGGFTTGDALIALSAVFWSLHMLITGLSVPYARPITFTAVQFFVLALLGGAAVVVTREPVTVAGLTAAADSIAFVGVLSSALTFTLLAVALKHTPPAEAAILVSMETLFAATAGAILLGERLSPIGWLGAAAMFTATLLVQLAPVLLRRQTTGKH
jgi:drug/metabolite transporter (DMT)-like permease